MAEQKADPSAEGWMLKDEQIAQACRDGFVWYPVVSEADRNIAKAQAKALIAEIEPTIYRLVVSVRRFAGEEMSDKLAACLILKGADTSDVERFLLMCEANDALELLWQELKEEVNDGR